MNNEIKICQIMIYFMGLVIGFMTQIMYPWFFLIMGSIIVTLLIKHTIGLMEEEVGDGTVSIKIR